MNAELAFPPFDPHPFLRGPHQQTIAAVYLPGRKYPYRARQHFVPLEDGDQLVLHDDRPESWRSGDRVALLIHGLAGCYLSRYMSRIAHKLNGRGVRTFRIDLRGCGAGLTLARLPYHSGRSADAATALRFVAEICPGSPAALIGFSLGGNIALKLLGELRSERCGGLDRCVAVCPPLDLAAASENILRPANRMYDQHFVKLLWNSIRARRRLVPSAPAVVLRRRPRTLFELDDLYTAPVSGFETAANYYRQCSSARFVPDIALPTLILGSKDDPLIPCSSFDKLNAPPSVHVHLTEHGGHLGFVGRPGVDPDRRWLDWRIVDWVTRKI